MEAVDAVSQVEWRWVEVGGGGWRWWRPEAPAVLPLEGVLVELPVLRPQLAPLVARRRRGRTVASTARRLGRASRLAAAAGARHGRGGRLHHLGVDLDLVDLGDGVLLAHVDPVDVLLVVAWPGLPRRLAVDAATDLGGLLPVALLPLLPQPQRPALERLAVRFRLLLREQLRVHRVGHEEQLRHRECQRQTATWLIKA